MIQGAAAPDLNRHLAGKAALITGSSKGLGRAIALRLAARGADVVINFRGDERAAAEVVEAARAHGARAVAIRADVSDLAGIAHLLDEALAAFDRLDIVVANAGVEKVDIPVVDVTEDDFDQLFRINTKGPHFVMQAAARLVADGGRILNIASSSTSHPQPGLGLYGTSKSAPKYLAKVLALELGWRGVTVNSLVPGPIDGAGIFTDVRGNDPHKKSLLDTVSVGRLATPEDVADFAEFLVSDRALFLTGEEVLMNGGSNN